MAGADPIIDLADIRSIKAMLRSSKNPRDFCLFVVGISTNLRASDLCRLTVGKVRYLCVGSPLPLVEKKTQKHRMITANSEFVEAVQLLIEHRLTKNSNLSDEELLFVGQRGPIVPDTIQKLVQKWTSSIHLDEKTADFGRKPQYSAHSLRKTFGYHLHTRFQVPLPELMELYNHSSMKLTLEYLSIPDSRIRDIYLKLSY